MSSAGGVLAAGDGERENFHRFARTPSAARRNPGFIICRYDIAGHSLNSRLCRVPGSPVKTARRWCSLMARSEAYVAERGAGLCQLILAVRLTSARSWRQAQCAGPAAGPSGGGCFPLRR
jgi:hypothetical protein